MNFSSNLRPNRTRNYVLIILLHSACISLDAQEADSVLPGNSSSIIHAMEDMVERSDAELDYSDFTDDLSRLEKHPVNLNAARDEDLQKLTFLNELQIANLRSYLQHYGSIASIYELQMIEGFSREVIALMTPYIKLTSLPQYGKTTPSSLLRFGKVDLTVRYQQVLERQQGYLPAPDSLLLANPGSRYLGGQGRLYTRFKYAYSDKLQFGFTAEKDPGETFLPANDTLKKGFDFFSAHVFYRGSGMVKQIAIGDYHVQFGQGLTIWSGLSYGKLPGEISGRKSGQSLRPSTSANENMLMRGAAATLGSGKMDLTLFYSSHYADANLLTGDTLDGEDAYFSSLQESGYHRTPGELSDKHTVRMQTAGGHVTFKTGTLHLGATAYQLKLDKAMSSSAAPASLSGFDKGSMITAGMDYAYLYKKLNIYGEISRSDSRAVAFVNGMTFAADPRFLFSAIYRNYPSEYSNLLCNAFAESSHAANEKGLYTGIVASLASKWTFVAYVDQYKYGWLRYRVDAPSSGAEYVAQVTWQASRMSEITLRFLEAHKQLNTSDYSYFNTLQATDKRDMRLHFSIEPLPYLSLKSRIEYCTYHDTKGTSRGYLVYQDIGIRPLKRDVSFIARFALFDAPSYESRLYAYENDVLYAFTSSSFYGVGSRFFVLATYKAGRNTQIWLRYSRTHYSDRQIISSGLDRIEGNNRSEIKVQLRLSL